MHTFDLWRNQIGDAGATHLSNHLQGSSLHTLDLWRNQIGDATTQLLKKEYSHIKWRFWVAMVKASSLWLKGNEATNNHSYS